MIKGDCLSKRYACVHITSRNEKVAFFYDKPFVYDDMKYMNDHVSCRVICQDNEVENITVKDIWDLFYDLSERDPSLVACASLVFYHLLYKTYHKELDLCLELENWMADTSKNVNAVWTMPVFPKDVIRALDERIGGVRLAKGSAISFEAFVYYWELRFINEEYSPPVPIVIYREKPSVPLRERICNLVIRIADYYMGTLSYGALLEMTANCLMDKPCKYHEISAATKGAVHSAVEELIKVLREEGVSYKEHYVFHVEGRRYTSVIAIPDKRVYLHSPFQNSPRGIIDTCDRFGNRHFFLSNIKDRTSFEEMASRVLMYAKEK